MDQLSTIPYLSLEELRKILKDNNVRETSSSKEELMNQVSEILLTNMMIQEIMENDTVNGTHLIQTPLVKDERTLLREQQDREYGESIHIDYLAGKNGNYLPRQPTQVDIETQEPIYEELSELSESSELSPRSLRAKRMEYFM